MIGIIIVGYNSFKDLPDCIKSIHQSSYSDFRVIFVNNTASDKSSSYLKEKYPDTIIIDNPANLGFATANNIGIKTAIKLGVNYIFILNPDTIIDQTCLEVLCENSNKKTILQPLVLNPKNNKINTTGSYLNFLGISYCNDYLKDPSGICKKEVPLSSGAAMFFHTSLISSTKGFDDWFFLYDEDMDLSWRARQFGYKISLLPNAIVWHKYSYSKNKLKYYYIERNRIAFLLKNFSLRYLILISPAFFLNEILMILYAFFNGWLILKIKSYFSLFLHLNKIITYRRAFKPVVGDKVLKNIIGSEINYQEINSILFSPYNLFLNIYWKIIKLFI